MLKAYQKEKSIHRKITGLFFGLRVGSNFGPHKRVRWYLKYEIQFKTKYQLKRKLFKLKLEFIQNEFSFHCVFLNMNF